MILAVNSSTPQYSLALVSVDGILAAEYTVLPGRSGFTGFMPALDMLLKSTGKRPEDIRCVCTAAGPGSFTGLRVGLSAAKGIAYSLNIPVIGISGIEALASVITHTKYPVCSMITSRRGEAFFGLFRQEGNSLTRMTEDRSIKLTELASLIRETTILIGNDFRSQWSIIAESNNSFIIPASGEKWNLRASLVGAIGLKRFKDGDFDDIRDIVPRYLSPPDIRPSV